MAKWKCLGVLRCDDGFCASGMAQGDKAFFGIWQIILAVDRELPAAKPADRQCPFAERFHQYARQDR